MSTPRFGRVFDIPVDEEDQSPYGPEPYRGLVILEPGWCHIRDAQVLRREEHPKSDHWEPIHDISLPSEHVKVIEWSNEDEVVRHAHIRDAYRQEKGLRLLPAEWTTQGSDLN